MQIVFVNMKGNLLARPRHWWLNSIEWFVKAWSVPN